VGYCPSSAPCWQARRGQAMKERSTGWTTLPTPGHVLLRPCWLRWLHSTWACEPPSRSLLWCTSRQDCWRQPACPWAQARGSAAIPAEVNGARSEKPHSKRIPEFRPSQDRMLRRLPELHIVTRWKPPRRSQGSSLSSPHSLGTRRSSQGQLQKPGPHRRSPEPTPARESPMGLPRGAWRNGLVAASASGASTPRDRRGLAR